MNIAIDIKDLKKQYRGKKGEPIEALRGLSMQVMQHEAFGLLGPNGAGKSTTIKILIGLIRPSSGYFNIQNVSDRNEDMRRLIGYLPENPSFFDNLTGSEFLTYVGQSYRMTMNAIALHSAQLLEELDLAAAANRPLRTYSKGMIQRIGLAQCLLHDPQILILDEPMSGLDPIGRMLVRDILLRLKREGKCILMSTHILNDVETICDRIGIIARGELQCIDSIEKINTEGITAYRVSIEGAADALLSKLGTTASVSILEHTVTHALLIIPRNHIESALHLITTEKNVSISLIEPIRKGLEELFAAVTK